MRQSGGLTRAARVAECRLGHSGDRDPGPNSDTGVFPASTLGQTHCTLLGGLLYFHNSKNMELWKSVM